MSKVPSHISGAAVPGPAKGMSALWFNETRSWGPFNPFQKRWASLSPPPPLPPKKHRHTHTNASHVGGPLAPPTPTRQGERHVSSSSSFFGRGGAQPAVREVLPEPRRGPARQLQRGGAQRSLRRVEPGGAGWELGGCLFDCLFWGGGARGKPTEGEGGWDCFMLL